MGDTRIDERFDALASEIHDWVESALSLGPGHFPGELLHDLRDLTDALAELADERGEDARELGLELFCDPEMAEVVGRFSRVRAVLTEALGRRMVEQIEEAGKSEFDDLGVAEDDEDDDG